MVVPSCFYCLFSSPGPGITPLRGRRSFAPPHHQTNGERLTRELGVSLNMPHTTEFSLRDSVAARHFISQGWGIYGGDNSSLKRAGLLPREGWQRELEYVILAYMQKASFEAKS
jgi:hypothetical protein